MVYYRNRALSDLLNIVDGLVNWQTTNGQKHLTRSQVFEYMHDVKRAFDGIDKLLYHHKAFYTIHKQYGKYVYLYKRNFRTSWYACYDWFNPNVFVNRVLNNYCTIS